MAEGREAVEFHQSYCKKPRIRPLDSSFTLEVKVQRPLQFEMPTWQYILTKVRDS
jgi:hypothetical protein